MRNLLSMALVAVAAVSMAQTPKTRVGQIWGAATNRMIDQQDIWFEDGDYLPSIQVLKLEAEKWPADYDIWTNLGWMEENVEEWDQALATYVRYRRQNPKDPDAALPEADYFNRKRLFSKVPELLEPEIKYPNCHRNNFVILARAYREMKMYADAVRVWKTLLKRSPNDGPAKHNLQEDSQKLAAGT